MPDDRAEPPDPKLTKRLESGEIMQAQLTQLLARVSEGFSNSEKRFDTQDTKLETLSNDRVAGSARMARFEVKLDEFGGKINELGSRMGAVEQRQDKTSLSVRGASATDLEHEAKIAENIVKTAQLETAIHETRAIAETTAAEIAKQSTFMGMGKTGLAWLRSKDARADIIRIVTLAGVAYTSAKALGIIK